jgi:quercetin dioxygenase-like cupin family protein
MIVRLYTGEDGQSHFEDITGPWTLDDRGREQTSVQDATGVRFTRYPVGYFSDWHTAPRCMYGIMLSGQVECMVGDGTMQRWGPGDIVLEEDLTGQGHTNRVMGGEPLLVAFVRL